MINYKQVPNGCAPGYTSRTSIVLWEPSLSYESMFSIPKSFITSCNKIEMNVVKVALADHIRWNFGVLWRWCNTTAYSSAHSMLHRFDTIANILIHILFFRSNKIEEIFSRPSQWPFSRCFHLLDNPSFMYVLWNGRSQSS